MRKNLIGGLVASLAALVLVSAPAFAASNVSVNFETPTYSIGNINGQDGWTKTGSYDAAVVANTYGYTSFGGQSLRISDAVTSGAFGDQTFAKPLADAVGEVDSTNGTFSSGTLQKHFDMQFDIASTMSAQQAGMHTSVSPDRGDGSRMSYLRFEDGPTGLDVFFDDVQGTTNPANFVETQIATGLSRTTAHKVHLTFDAVDGPSNDVVKVYIDGALVHTGTSWENYYRFDSEAAAEPSPRIVKTVEFRESGTANPANLNNGFLFDNLSLSSGSGLIAPPTNKNQCKNDGWKVFNNPSFKNQGKCIDYVRQHSPRVEGTLFMSDPSQKIKFSSNSDGGHERDNNGKNQTVEYWNYDFTGGVLHYKANVMCTGGDSTTGEARVMFRVPAGNPLSGLYVVSSVKESHQKNVKDLYGHASTTDLATATQWCQTGVGFSPTPYVVTKGEVEVN